jgi:hypothetical protein
MPTYDALTEDEQDFIKELSDEVRMSFKICGLKVCNDDRVARFDEALAVYYKQCKDYTKELACK